MISREVLVLTIFATLLAGCVSDALDPTAVGGYAVPVNGEGSKPLAKPAVLDPALVAKGEQLYKQNCVFCHQADAIGKPGVAPSLTNKEFLSLASDRFLVDTIRKGRAGTGMPPFAHLGKEKIKAIVIYLRAHAILPSRAAEVEAGPDAHGDPRLGKTWYDQICATCHGPDGDGYASGGTGTAIGKRGFLSNTSDGFIRTTIKEGRSNTRMRGFQGHNGLADLSNQEIDDIIVYLRSLPQRAKSGGNG
jgi:mono/diheme cytochrome c family protein